MNDSTEPTLEGYATLSAEEFEIRIVNNKPTMLYRPYLGRRTLTMIAALVIAVALVPIVACLIGTVVLTSGTPMEFVVLFAGCFLVCWLAPVTGIVVFIRRCQRGHF